MLQLIHVGWLYETGITYKHHIIIYMYVIKFGGIPKLMYGVDIDNISQYTGISYLLNRLNIDIASNLFWAKTGVD